MIPRPIETAPADGSWILGFVGEDERPAAKRHPWAILARCDGGWGDEEGYLWWPTQWVPLPDPQPAPTNYAPPVGTIRISFWHIMFAVWVELPTGERDEARDHYPCGTLSAARDRAREWSGRTGLPVIEDPDLPEEANFSGAAMRFLTGGGA
jgi:hypothetical protein